MVVDSGGDGGIYGGVDYKRPQCASMLRFNWCSIGVLALVRVVAIPLGKCQESREFLVCLSSFWIEVVGGFEPCELCVVVVVGGSIEDLFEEYKSPRSYLSCLMS